MSDYDSGNVFAKMLRGEITPDIIYQDEYVFAFHDAYPKAKVHVLIIPKGAYKNITQFGERASDAELIAMLRAVPKVAEMVGIKEGGYRTLINCDKDGGQEVPHLHLHLLGGEFVKLDLG
ncbi:MAG: HIT-like protein [Alphaproteobacteria bacterium]|nr:HIT-like protein [Alphaproteobacteria bacterium]